MKNKKFYAFSDGFPVCWSYDLRKLQRYILLYRANGMTGEVTITETMNTVNLYPYTIGPDALLHETPNSTYR